MAADTLNPVNYAGFKPFAHNLMLFDPQRSLSDRMVFRSRPSNGGHLSHNEDWDMLEFNESGLDLEGHHHIASKSVGGAASNCDHVPTTSADDSNVPRNVDNEKTHFYNGQSTIGIALELIESGSSLSPAGEKLIYTPASTNREETVSPTDECNLGCITLSHAASPGFDSSASCESDNYDLCADHRTGSRSSFDAAAHIEAGEDISAATTVRAEYPSPPGGLRTMSFADSSLSEYEDLSITSSFMDWTASCTDSNCSLATQRIAYGQSHGSVHIPSIPQGVDLSFSPFDPTHGLAPQSVATDPPLRSSFADPPNTHGFLDTGQKNMSQLQGTRQQTYMHMGYGSHNNQSGAPNMHPIHSNVSAACGIPLDHANAFNAPAAAQIMLLPRQLTTSSCEPRTVPSLATGAPLRQDHLSQHPSVQLPSARSIGQPNKQKTLAAFTYPRAIAKAPDGRVRDAVLPSQADKPRKGGRKKNEHLQPAVLAYTNRMRHVGSCWPCSLMREQCTDKGEDMPCERCFKRSAKHLEHPIGCVRVKLPDLIYDFLPSQYIHPDNAKLDAAYSVALDSLTMPHGRQSIEDSVVRQVDKWFLGRSITCSLTSGYGPPQRWKLYEFRPGDKELLEQLQYLQDSNTGVQVAYKKYSPPLALRDLDSTDIANFENYLNVLMEAGTLCGLGRTFFAEDSEIDFGHFEAKLLGKMCQLYLTTGDKEVRDVLDDVLRLLIVTYIMGHTLTIVQETLPSVMGSMRHSAPAQHCSYVEHTSPTLANRQLKFFFSIIRERMSKKVLSRLQQTIKHRNKQELWLPSFCAMLGVAMWAEETQTTIAIQAEANIVRKDMRADAAKEEGYNACHRIDGRFDFMTQLFQHKYRDRSWGANGSFGNGTPQLRDRASHDFLQSVRELVEERSQYLAYRQTGKLGDPSCQYTGRHCARFLLPFLGLPS